MYSSTIKYLYIILYDNQTDTALSEWEAQRMKADVGDQAVLRINDCSAKKAGRVIYKVYVDYPAESALKTISDNLRAAGWKPLKADFWNPSIPSSHVRGWQQFDDATSKPTTTVKSWMTQWENPRHDIISYTLEYRYPVDAKPDLNTRQVIAIYIPASVAATMPKANH
jgi:hypothetical protein